MRSVKMLETTTIPLPDLSALSEGQINTSSHRNLPRKSFQRQQKGSLVSLKERHPQQPSEELR